MRDKPTIKDIAKLAKVSIGTVDRVLHDRGDVSKETIQLVKSIMDKVNYVPNTFARNLVLNKNFKIAVLLPKHTKGEYWTEPLNGAKKALKAFKTLGISVNVYLYDQKSKQSFFDTGKQIFNDKNDAVLLAQVLYHETEIFLKKCKLNGIPFVLIGSGQHNSGAISYIGQNSYQGGRLAGELISLGQKKESKFLILNITKAQNPNFNVNERIAGFESYFEDNCGKHCNIEIFSVAQEDKKIIQKIKKKLNSQDNIKGIFVPNSKSFILAKALLPSNQIRIVGYDLLDKNKQLLEDKKIDFLINQRPFEQAFQGIEYLYKFLGMQQQPPQVVSLPLDIVTHEKLMYY
ncbi:LacI family DNA-binding transcriptional regulator [Zobellia roscoffensis]|uniref:LacI family DNA-binding transcriptional regulator n=1 Tax=Zobellia roscoffensis TaxID=2779508 RepID=UPI00188BD7A0|nr:LacI family DNA-binding transcriptional regulator [Zobellia roscoffensis]